MTQPIKEEQNKKIDRINELLQTLGNLVSDCKNERSGLERKLSDKKLSLEEQTQLDKLNKMLQKIEKP